ncbi:NADH dehydrogenase subunit D [Desulfobulbus propionicus DSM 2032]|uniref:NADH-quinone oxidoreductase subunit D n=1 Tax=Desulfobulbus propionicus (strain ATCC 33891 / DSM 2032 / VKM B-1956 / 1pr3) TaxID=577650 RepID=A0A7U4DPI1_DESPD|nr:NADH-quinone oxidoreductase subunit D [Desulfobulbus propionicus]ADW18012.1 NADH dehydrogenase subunit D [Desulfobulbus propionicus DSM 2032]
MTRPIKQHLEIPVADGAGERYSLRMGPQHPATHGVLRVDLELDGETIIECIPQVGYLHRGFEKLAENKTYAQALILTDRLDYIAAMANNVGYCVAVERLLGISVPLRAQYIRTIVGEMSRLCSHLLWLATHALDIGAMTVFLYCFREREILLDLFEELCGARLTFSYPRIGGVRQDVTSYFVDELQRFLDMFPSKIEEYETLIDTNRIWLKRTVGVGTLTGEEALALGLTGACLRGSGVDYDIRKHQPYDAYPLVDFEVPLGSDGDIYARYRCRMEEMHQSVRIIQQCIDQLPPGPIIGPDAPDLVMPNKVPARIEAGTNEYGTGLIKLIRDRNLYISGDVYVATEVPKGELGFYFISDGNNRPYRMHIRSPSFIHIGALAAIAKGELIADLIANIGSLDVVLGESDR